MAAIQEGAAAAATEAALPEPQVVPRARRAAWKLLAWALLWVVLASLGSFIVSLAFGLVLYFTEDGYVLEALQEPDIGGTNIILSTLILMLLLSWFGLRNARRAADGDLREGLGWLPLRNRRQLALMTAALLVYGLVLSFLNVNPYPELTGQMRAVNPLLLVPGALLVGVIGPIAEELFFRGWLWTALRKYWSVPRTMLATGLFWYAIHFTHGLLYMAILLPAIVVITLVRQVGGSLRASILVHVIYNSYCVVCWLVMAFVLQI
ncbi:MAG: CPBP family intramembrane metalloprotease [Alphaproteobacteria bacterium]|nr:CPBP family intramembrane metalloprotease [Alphaproteobacteria bacterium]